MTDQELDDGVVFPDRTGAPVRYRRLRPSDDLTAITRMLHSAYRPLADAGMRFLASHQDEETTRRRAARGETLVASSEGRVIGIVTWGASGGTPHYERAGVSTFGQFAVDPSFQHRGIGSRLLELVERRAREADSRELALDTSEQAADLIRLYEAKGFRFVEHTRWDVVNYRSVVMSKDLARSAE